MIFESKSNKNLKHFQMVVVSILADIEKSTSSGRVSCISCVLIELEPILEKSREQAKKWDADFDYTAMAYKIIYNITFDLLSSGRFHLDRGVLNPMSEAPNLYKACVECLNYYQQMGIVNASQKNEQLDILNENIAFVG